MTGRKKGLAVCLCLTMLLSVCTPLISSAAVVTVGASVSTNHAVEVVSTQAKLESALTKSSVKQIVIKTGKAVSFEIPKGNYSDKKLAVRAPKAEIKNAGTFKNVTIYAVSDQGYTENADHNKIRVLAASGKIVVPAGKTADLLTVTRKNSRVRIEVSGTVQQMDVKKAANLAMEVTGSIKKMNVNATSTIAMTGNSKDTTIIVNKAAKNSHITISAPATVKLKAAATVTLKSGAEDAKLVVLKSSKTAVSYTLVNDTNSTLKLNTSTGIKTLAKGKSYDGKESGSSNGAIIGGGSGGGSSAGSGGSGGGSTEKPGDDKPVIKQEIPVAAKVKDLHTFCVYVDAEKAPDALAVAVSPSAGEVTQSAQGAGPEVFYAEDGSPQHVYGFCYTYTTTEPLRLDTEYTVSIEETEACRFEEQRMNTATLKESLKPYEDKLKAGLESVYIEAAEGDTEEAIVEKIEKWLNNPGPKEALREAVQLLEADHVTIEGISVKDIKVNDKCPVNIRLQKDGIDQEFICTMFFVDKSTEEGELLYCEHYIQNILAYSYHTNGPQPLAKSVNPSMPKIDKWESGNLDLITITDSYTAEVTLPAVGVEEVTLTAYLSKEGQLFPVKKTVTVDSGSRVAEYTVNIVCETDGTLRAETRLQADSSGAINHVEGALAYQWYRMAVGSNAAVEEIVGATGESYTPEGAEETGAFWYYCKVTNTVHDDTMGIDKTVESYSDFVIVTNAQ